MSKNLNRVSKTFGQYKKITWIRMVDLKYVLFASLVPPIDLPREPMFFAICFSSGLMTSYAPIKSI